MIELIVFINIKAILLGESIVGKTPVKNEFNDENFKIECKQKF